MSESVEWERLADHEEAPGDRAELTRRPLCDRISYVADQLEASITGLRGLVGVSRTRVVLAASVVTLREVADLVLDQGVELDDLRAEAAEPFNPQRIAEAVKRARRQRDEAVEAIAAERDEYVEELARLREQLQSAAVLPERWRELPAERDAARRELAEVRERVAAQVTDHLRRRAHDAAIADVNGYSCEAAATWMAAAQLVESSEWKVADDA